MIGIDKMHISCRKNKQLNYIHKGQQKHPILCGSIRTHVLILYLNFFTLSHKIILRIQVRFRVCNKILLYNTRYLTVK